MCPYICCGGVVVCLCGVEKKWMTGGEARESVVAVCVCVSWGGGLG